MLRFYAFAILCLINAAISCETGKPRVVIVGAGAAGIAAATKLLENGIQNVVILEAEDRIGGRVCTVEFDDYVVDLGAQWVHGEKGNVAYDLAAPLDLIEHATMEADYYKMYESTGKPIDSTIVTNVLDFYRRFENESESLTNYNISYGETFENELKKYFKEHPEINEKMQNELLWHFNLAFTSMDPADNWYDISPSPGAYEECEGDRVMNWKEKGYGTILDILMKKIPDPTKELPVMSKTVLNTEVAKVDYTNEDGTVKVTTKDGKEYIADHVIMTPSLGVLKAEHETLFDPALPECKVNSIKGLGFGTAAKIFLAFSDEWFAQENEKDDFGFACLWSEDERKQYENDPEKKWMLGSIGFFRVQHKPRLLFSWVSSEGARVLDTLPDDLVFNQTKCMLNKFLSQDYNVTEPTKMIRSKWTTNKHFLGTYSYRSLESEKRNASSQELLEPIMRNEKPVILFAGEATSIKHSGTVNGAIESGWREADRLISLYNGNAKNAESS